MRAIRVLVAGIGIGVGAAGAGSAVSAVAPPGGVVVTVTNAGDPAQLVDLTPVRTVGQVSVESRSQAVIGNFAGPGVSYEVSVDGTSSNRTEVVDALADGSYGVHSTLLSFSQNVISGGEFAEEILLPEAYQALQGVPVAVSMSAQNARLSGAPVAGTTLTAEQGEAFADFWSIPQIDPTVFPDQPVGVGGTWTATLAPALVDVTLPMAFTFTLISVTGGQNQVQFDASADFSQATGAYVDGYTPAGTITVSGTITTTANDPLSWNLSMQTTNQLTVADGSAVATLNFDHWVELVSAPG